MPFILKNIIRFAFCIVCCSTIVYADCQITCCPVGQYGNAPTSCTSCPNDNIYNQTPQSDDSCTEGQYGNPDMCSNEENTRCFITCPLQFAVQIGNKTVVNLSNTSTTIGYYNAYYNCTYPTATCVGGNAVSNSSCNANCAAVLNPPTMAPNAQISGTITVNVPQNNAYSIIQANNNSIFNNCTATGTQLVQSCSDGKTAQRTTYTYNGTSWQSGTVQKICAGGYYLPSGAQCCQPVGKSHYSANCNTGDRSQCPLFTTTCGTTAAAANDCAKEKVQFKDNRGSFYLHGGNVACPTGNNMPPQDSATGNNWYQNCT